MKAMKAKAAAEPAKGAAMKAMKAKAAMKAMKAKAAAELAKGAAMKAMKAKAAMKAMKAKAAAEPAKGAAMKAMKAKAAMKAMKAMHDNRAAAPLDGYPVGKGGTLRDGHRHHGLARVGGGFGHRDLDLSRLGASDTDLTGAVAHDDGGAEAHVGATLRDLRDALHLDDVLGE